MAQGGLRSGRLRDPAGGGGSGGGFEEEDEQRRLSFFHLFGLAAGGAIGSGWLWSGQNEHVSSGAAIYLPWVIGGLVMLVIAAVMVELGTAAPKTGGLIFLPLQSSGPLVATVVAAGLWIVYAINSASEAVAMTKGLRWTAPSLLDHTASTLTTRGWGCALGFMVLIFAVNLIAPRIFFRVNSWLTVVKIAMVLLTVVLLALSGFDHHHAVAAGHQSGESVFSAVVDDGVVYAYVGFQGPLDFAGNVRRRGIGEAARLRRAVFATIILTMVLYTALQFVRSEYAWYQPGNLDSPYTYFAFSTAMTWFGWCLRADTLISPMGAGLVFGHALTREVAALSRAHLTHRGLQAARKATLKRRYEVYWLVLLVDFFIGGLLMLAMNGNWSHLTATSGILTLVVYAMPGVALVSLRGHLPGFSPRRGRAHQVLARVSFVLIALIFYGAGWSAVWRGMAALGVGCVLLLGLPLLSNWLPGFGRIYDAKMHVRLFREWRTNPTARAGCWLIGYLALLTLLTLLGRTKLLPSSTGLNWEVTGAVLAGLSAVVTFEALVRTSRRHLLRVPPMLPTAASTPAAAPAPVAAGR